MLDTYRMMMFFTMSLHVLRICILTTHEDAMETGKHLSSLDRVWTDKTSGHQEPLHKLEVD